MLIIWVALIWSQQQTVGKMLAQQETIFFQYWILIAAINSKNLVPHTWVEQVLPRERDFESRASTSSANGARKSL